ncbi:hypothetical protein B296_00006489 [Ensete ventricosum]|uniref:Uncharacterized protein n=1 Tax=Ensete ventricosum TaxID=4639 RepID=A0A427A6T7_ENSVE|nr:hypothetical protein B296_00006489 [Ensete ventricosum]
MPKFILSVPGGEVRPFHQFFGVFYLLVDAVEDQLLWEVAEPTVTYCQGALSLVLAGLVYHYPLKVVVDLCSRNEPEEERRVAEARVAELFSQLTQAHLQAEEAEQCLMEEARGSTTVTEDEGADSMAEAKEQVEKNQAPEWKRRVMASYKESEGFQYGFRHSNRAIYEFMYQIATGWFKVRYPELEIDEDPYVELPSDVKVPTPVEVPFDDRLTSLLALPPLV